MSSDPLDKEIEDALNGVDLQAIDGRGSGRGAARGAGGDRLYPGTILGVHGDDVIVELGPTMQGVCSKREFDEEPKVGDVHRFSLRGRDEELWILSMREAKELASWEQLEVGSHTKARVTGQNQGGLSLKIGSHDAFMPTSQVSVERNFDASSLLGQTITAEVLGTTLLGQVPLFADIRAGGDCGMPVTVSAPDSRPAVVFRSIAAALLARLKV